MLEIACDIDGTVLDFSDKFTRWMADRGDFILNKDILKNHANYLIYETENFDDCFDLPLYNDCKNVLDNLAMKNKMTFISKRAAGSNPSIKQKLEILTINWQRNVFPYFTGVFFTKDKTEYFKNKMFDLMLEDDAKNANSIAEYVPVILFSRSWNNGIELHKNVILVEDWKEAEFVINNIEKFAKK